MKLKRDVKEVKKVKEEAIVVGVTIDEPKEEVILDGVQEQKQEESNEPEGNANEPEAETLKEEKEIVVAVVEEVAPTIVVGTSTPAPIVDKRVKVLMKKDHRCNIGGEWLDLKKGKIYPVSEFVKSVLAGEDLLSPL